MTSRRLAWPHRVWGWGLLLLMSAPAGAAAQAPPATYVLIVTGASGEPRFAATFHAQAMALRSAALNRFGIADSAIFYLAEDKTKDPAAIRDRSTREGVEKAIGQIAGRARSGDRVLVLLIGHGSTQSEQPRFSLPGPDLSAADFAKLLDRLRSQSVAFVNASSASGDFIKALAAPNRIVVTATKSSHEGNETLFSQHFVAAYVADGADVDKDGRVSLLEAFDYARREVQREYEKTNRLQTEHAMLDDDGDGVGHGDASEKGPDGLRARSFHLAAAAGVTAALANDPRAAELLATQTRLQAQVDSLRALRSGMKEDDFQKLLEPLLLKLAETNQALRALQVKKP
jgi:hypothetical protein